MIGRTVSHYKILEKLGQGGMGVVYKAEDLTLKRTVALKFLPPELARDKNAKARFTREAQAASSLDHPNICSIHEIGETSDGHIFIVMSCYEGESLQEKIERGPLKLDEAVDIGIQVVSGLAKAHEKEIVHRDIKPGNILIANDGLAKIVDFGLAKLSGRTRLTRQGTVPGTVSYMSPEQLRGGDIDHRSDIWALGVVLYEMITGETPFRGEYEQAMSYSIMNEAPRPVRDLRPDVPAEMERIIEKTLSKDPNERYQKSTELLDALQSLKRRFESSPVETGGSAAKDAPSIAVLPFRDMSPQRDQEYFCEGIAEELLNALVQIEGLHVAARTSSDQFKDKRMDVRAIGRGLGVKSVLEGSVRKSGERLRITAQLVNVEDGYHLFSEKYDRTAEDIFAIQDEISLAIVDRLKVKLLKGEESRLTKRHTENEEAYRLYLQGRYFWNRRHEGGLQRGLEYFQKAIAIDPEYALPYSGMADCYFSLGWYNFLAPTEAFGKTKEAAAKALEIDPDLAEAHASLAVAIYFLDWDGSAAEAEFRRAIALNPNYATAHHFYSLCLAAMGRFDEAIAEVKRAQRLDPVQPVMRTAQAFVVWMAGQYEEAVAASRAAIEFDPNFFTGWLLLGASRAEAGDFAEAADALRRADNLTGGTSTLVLWFFAYVLGRSGKQDEARSILDRLLEFRRSKYASAEAIASLYGVLGQQDAAFEWMENAIEERDHWLCYAKYLPHLSGLRSDPRFQKVLRRIGLDVRP